MDGVVDDRGPWAIPAGIRMLTLCVQRQVRKCRTADLVRARNNQGVPHCGIPFFRFGRIIHRSCSGLRKLCFLRSVDLSVTLHAHSDQVLVRVLSRMTPEFPVMHLKIQHRTAGLASPAIAPRDLLAQSFIRDGIKPQGDGIGRNHSQDAFSRRSSRKAFRCSPGKNL
jgi:hypothetical protein